MEFRDFFDRPAWAFRQLLPLRYVSSYQSDGESRSVVWRMWLGRCFAIDDKAVTIADDGLVCFDPRASEGDLVYRGLSKKNR